MEHSIHADDLLEIGVGPKNGFRYIQNPASRFIAMDQDKYLQWFQYKLKVDYEYRYGVSLITWIVP
jgi:hypothetical protein